MYSNSSILTPSEFANSIYSYFDIDNPYFNSQRFANIHCSIFIAAFVLVVVLFILKDTLFLWIRICVEKYRIKIDVGEEEQISADFY